MVKKVRTAEDVIHYISKKKSEKNTTFSEIEQECNFSAGSMTKWKTAFPSIERVLKALNFLGVDVLLKDRENPESEKTSDDSEPIETEKESDNKVDPNLLLSAIVKILDSKDLSVEDKKRLLKILESFS